GGEAVEVPAVGQQGVLGQPALGLQVVAEGLDVVQQGAQGVGVGRHGGSSLGIFPVSTRRPVVRYQFLGLETPWPTIPPPTSTSRDGRSACPRRTSLSRACRRTRSAAGPGGCGTGRRGGAP